MEKIIRRRKIKLIKEKKEQKAIERLADLEFKKRIKSTLKIIDDLSEKIKAVDEKEIDLSDIYEKIESLKVQEVFKEHNHKEFYDLVDKKEFKKYVDKINQDSIKISNNLVDLFKDIEQIGLNDTEIKDKISKFKGKTNRRLDYIKEKLIGLSHSKLKDLEWSKSGHVIDDNINLEGFVIKNSGIPIEALDLTTKAYVDGIAQRVRSAGGGGGGVINLYDIENLDAGNRSIFNLEDPSDPQDAVTKAYADALDHSIDIGDPVTGSTNSSVLFIDGGLLAQDNSNFTFNNATDTLYSKYLSTTSLALSGFVEGGVIFQGATALTQDATNLFWDNTNKRVGIGTDSPASPLHVYAGASGTTPIAGTIATLEDDNNAYFSFLTRDTDISGFIFGSASDSLGAGVLWRYDDKLLKVQTGTATGEISLQTANKVEAIRIDENQNVGIGTASPSVPLDVSSGVIGLLVGADANAQTRTNATDKAGRIGIPHYLTAEEPVAVLLASSSSTHNRLDFGGGTSLMNAATLIRFFTGGDTVTTTGTERMKIDQFGRVYIAEKLGIGTTSPSATFQVHTTHYGYPSTTYATTRDNSAFIFSSSITGTQFLVGIGDDGLGNWIQAQHTGGSARNLILNPIGGNVGIGTDSPDSTLHLRGSNCKLTFEDSDTGGEAYIQTDNAGNFYFNYGSSGGADIRFYSATTELARLKDDGFFGIGINPTSKMHILGSGSSSATSALHVENLNRDSLLFVRNDGNVGIGTDSPGVKTEILSTTTQLRLTHTDGVDEADFLVNSDGNLSITPTSRTIYLGDGTAGDSIFGFQGNTSIFTLTHDDSEGALDLSANDATNFTRFGARGQITLPAGTATAGTAPLKFTAGTALTTPETGTIEFHDDRFWITNVDRRRAIDRTNDIITATTEVVNTTDETTIYTGYIEANGLKVSNVLKLHCDGIFSNNSASDDITIRIYIGTDELLSFNPAIGNVTDAHWHIDGNITVRTTGASGTVAYHLDAIIDDHETLITGLGDVDTTAAQNFTVTVEWDNDKADNSFKIYQGYTEWKG